MCNGVLNPAIQASEPRSVRGKSINRLCSCLADAEERRQFHLNEDAYCLRFGLNENERQAIKDRDFLTLIDLGAHVVHLNELAALSGLSTLEAIRMRAGVSGLSVIDRLLRTDS